MNGWIEEKPTATEWIDSNASQMAEMSDTHRMGETAAKVLAASAGELLTDPGLLKAARAEYKERLGLPSEEPLVPKGL